MTIKFGVVEGIVKKVSGRWPRNKLDALKESIRKWEFIVAALNRHWPEPLAGSNSCALCHLYLWDGCYECPVYERTKIDGCSNTPYADYRNAPTRQSAIKVAKREVAFLKKLVPIVEAEMKEKSSKKKTWSRK